MPYGATRLSATTRWTLLPCLTFTSEPVGGASGGALSRPSLASCTAYNDPRESNASEVTLVSPDAHTVGAWPGTTR